MSDDDLPHSFSLSVGEESSRWIESIQNYNDLNENNDKDDNDNDKDNDKEDPFESSHQSPLATIPSRPSLGSRSSSYSSDSDTSLPATPLTPKFNSDINLPSENFYNHQDQEYTKTPKLKATIKNDNSRSQSQETPKTIQVTSTPRTVDRNYRKIVFQETPKKQIINRVQAQTGQETLGLKTPPNSKLRNLVRQPLLEPQPIILRPTTFWRRHPLSPHCLPKHSPSSRLIRRSTLIASPTICRQHPDPDQETTRICVGLAGIDLDIDPRDRRLSLVPI
ncbi:hypothetical protein V865_006120 [Kwoniella europaea PYCC6329]|uniref:PH domain-containing protein n=1 Tax=Kwoniella europaea PYCC6329 TaxID=1423913 RepID=A0AAX4KR06_9TREE